MGRRGQRRTGKGTGQQVQTQGSGGAAGLLGSLPGSLPSPPPTPKLLAPASQGEFKGGLQWGADGMNPSGSRGVKTMLKNVRESRMKIRKREIWLDISGGYHFYTPMFPIAAVPDFEYVLSCQILRLTLEFCKSYTIKPQIQGS